MKRKAGKGMGDKKPSTSILVCVCVRRGGSGGGGMGEVERGKSSRNSEPCEWSEEEMMKFDRRWRLGLRVALDTFTQTILLD